VVDLQELQLNEPGRERAVLFVRLVAALRQIRAGIREVVAVALVAAALAGVLAATGAGPALAADPTADPGATATSPRTCAQRYPDEGPAGVDLRLGCIIGELVGHYRASAAQDATPASSYALVVLGVLVAGFAAIWLVGRLLGRAAGRRLAPVQPGAWWLCATCRSVNGVGVTRCYSCGAAPPDGPTLRTDDAPSTTQSFGSTRKRG
jgi:hypothetical protein